MRKFDVLLLQMMLLTHFIVFVCETILEMSYAEKEFRADAHIHNQEFKAVGGALQR